MSLLTGGAQIRALLICIVKGRHEVSRTTLFCGKAAPKLKLQAPAVTDRPGCPMPRHLPRAGRPMATDGSAFSHHEVTENASIFCKMLRQFSAKDPKKIRALQTAERSSKVRMDDASAESKSSASCSRFACMKNSRIGHRLQPRMWNKRDDSPRPSTQHPESSL